VPKITIDPPYTATHFLDNGDTPFQRLFRRGAIAYMTYASGIGSGQFEGMKLIVIPGPKIHTGFVTVRFGQAIDTGKEIQALIKLVRKNLNMTKMSDVMAKRRHFTGAFGIGRADHASLICAWGICRVWGASITPQTICLAVGLSV
jgi:hypothetical protein